MTYRVIITPNAEGDLRAAYRYIRQQAPASAGAWVRGARKKIKSLEKQPERATLAPENGLFGEDIREVFYGDGNRGTHRILFTIRGERVYVLHFRHGSMLPVKPEMG